MIGKNFYYKGSKIPYSKADGVSDGWYADINWTNLAVRNSNIPRGDYHGVISNPTLAEGRIINVDGEIFNTNKISRGSIRNTIDNLFQLEYTPSQGEGFYNLAFTDDDNTDWVMQAKVYSKPEYSHERASSIIEFNCQLYCQDPTLRSSILNTDTTNYGSLGGISLPTELPIALNGAINPLIINNTGNFVAPFTATITGEILNPKIYNATTGAFYKLNIEVESGNELIIQSDFNQETTFVTLNDVNIESERADGSEFFYLIPGENILVLLGDDFDFDNQAKAQMQIDFYSRKM